MNLFTTLIIDDEPQARNGLKTLLKRDTSIQLLASCANGVEAINQINQLQPQIIFLDIQMPEVNGFDVLNSINPQHIPLVIFTTAYDKYALRAFEVHAVDYLLKPFTDTRFFEALSLAKHSIRQKAIEEEHRKLKGLLKQYTSDERLEKRGRILGRHAEPMMQDRLAIKYDGKIHFLFPKDICYITAEDYYVKIYLEKQKFLVRDSLKALLQRLPEPHFIRIHRSTVVNLSCVQSISPYQNGDYYLYLTDGTSLRGSRNYRDIFRQFEI